MTEERWNLLMKSDSESLTQDELDAGWHFCYDWDGLLINSAMGEAEHCNCA